MLYLLAKMFLLLLLAAVLGFVLGRWWVRRQFRDVTEEYARLLSSGASTDYSPALERIAQDVQAGRDDVVRSVGSIEGRLRDLIAVEVAKVPVPDAPVMDLAPVEHRVVALQEALTGRPEPDIDGVFARIERLQGTVEGLDPSPPPTDLTPVLASLQALDAQVGAIDVPTQVDLTPIVDRLESLQRRIEGLRPPEPTPVDLTGLETQLATVLQAVRSIEIPPPADLNVLRAELTTIRATLASDPVDLGPVEVRLAAIEAALRDLRIPPAVDLAPLQARLVGFEEWVRSTLAAPPPPVEGPPLYKAATFGPKDDLKRISGVGPVLEKLLNDLGVYYFFQVAHWSPGDVQYVDDRLEAFKGRIKRDDWVVQAKQLAKTSRVKPPPGMDDTSFGLEPGAEIPDAP